MVKRFKTIDAEDGERTYLKKLIDEGTILKNNENRKVRSSMYASDYGQCQRKIFFQFKPDDFVVDEIEPRVLRIFHNGNDVHERLGGYLKKNEALGFVDEVNVPRNHLDVHGRCDGICTIDERAFVVEFKSINKDSVSEPKEEHVGQLTWYLHMFKGLRKDLKEDFGFEEHEFLRPEDLQGAIGLSGLKYDDLNHVQKWLLFTQGEIMGEIIYESKSKNETFHFPLEYNSERAKKIQLWYEQLKWYIDQDEIPAVKYNPSYFPCSWKGGACQYFNTCWGHNGVQGIGAAGIKRADLIQIRSSRDVQNPSQ